ncbi:phosphate ABC transporter substrate-binding protein [Clostridium sp. C2-6-12]|uniref:phosphate ABC transporter substrate-binding protein n=1 Tax=Clostridium sp. C2-6-12 TaxID=2698832 RepID=UPI00136BBE7C|nr:phosphate ABC transporter substrate-binding protein [Clostridium sp. C2-6-12]
MKNSKRVKIILSWLFVLLIGSFIAACGNNSEKESEYITISGSSALLPLMEKSIEKFNEKYLYKEIGAQAGGSGTGLAQVLNGAVNIGNSDMPAEEKLDKALADKLIDHKVIAQGFGVVVNKSLGIENLSSNEIRDIFSGKISNWKEVGGPNKEILLIHRTAGSGTRATFERTLLGGDKTLENDSIGVTQDSNGAVLSVIKSNDGAISYLSLVYMNTGDAKKSLNTLKIDGVACNKENIINNSYKFWSWGHMYTKGEATGLTKEFIEFISSRDNYSSIESLGFISGSEMKVK